MQSGSAATGVFVRSQIEIVRTLETVSGAGEPLTALLGDKELRFTSRLLLVDTVDGFILIEYSASKSANTALLAQQSVTFHCNDGAAHLEFVVGAPRETRHQDRAAIRFPLPGAIVRMHRREHTRVWIGDVAESVSLRCIASAGADPFEARVTDVSPGGLGTIIYSARVRLETGMHLPRSKIMFPMGRTVLVDLQVCHVQPATLEDGTPAQRAGCRFVGGARDLAELIGVYVREIGGTS